MKMVRIWLRAALEKIKGVAIGYEPPEPAEKREKSVSRSRNDSRWEHARRREPSRSQDRSAEIFENSQGFRCTSNRSKCKRLGVRSAPRDRDRGKEKGKEEEEEEGKPRERRTRDEERAERASVMERYGIAGGPCSLRAAAVQLAPLRVAVYASQIPILFLDLYPRLHPCAIRSKGVFENHRESPAPRRFRSRLYPFVVRVPAFSRVS